MSKALRGEVWEVEFRPAVGAEIQKLGQITAEQAEQMAAAIALCVGY